MKLTCMMIVALLFLTAWTFVTAVDSKNELENRGGWGQAGGWGKLFPMARDEMKNSEVSKLDNKRKCAAAGEACVIPIIGNVFCCKGYCLFVCIS
uniref:Conotoxin Qc6.1 n=1 Tax=Conus quercinus TaxID=101313 RepID=O161_CONQU|nr:RecName: Full=Conotoxin Qc6.1; Flags: Precursor [Conus quercinus]